MSGLLVLFLCLRLLPVREAAFTRAHRRLRDCVGTDYDCQTPAGQKTEGQQELATAIRLARATHPDFQAQLIRYLEHPSH